jgi:2-polyprenyl-3-methyl-5-hydroxy-6-metoxy-1,4-benzoquinol methylase
MPGIYSLACRQKIFFGIFDRGAFHASPIVIEYESPFDTHMENDSRNKAEKFWDRAAASYDREEKKDGKTHLHLIQHVKSYLKLTDRVLDFGCGTGLFSNGISDAVKTVHAIDFSAKMIELAKAKAQKENTDYFHAGIFDDRLTLGSYDVILSFYILHLLEDPRLVILHMHKLLKPGGLLISVTPCMGEKPLLAGLFSILGKIALVPQIRPFTLKDLEKLLTIESFEISENKLLPGTSNQYVVISKKTNHHVLS